MAVVKQEIGQLMYVFNLGLYSETIAPEHDVLLNSWYLIQYIGH